MTTQYIQYPGVNSNQITFPLTAPDGAPGTPSYSFTSDSTYGMYFATGVLAFATNGTRAGYFDSAQAFHLPSGNLNLGATTNQIVIQPGDTGFEFIFTCTTPAQNTFITIPDPAAASVHLLLDHGANTITGAWAFNSSVTLANSTNQLVFQPGGTGFTTTINCPNPSGQSNIYTIPDAGGAASFVMTTGAQTLSSKTIQFPTSGGTPTSLNYYEEGTLTANFNAAAGAGGSSTSNTVSFVRIGKIVTLQFPSYAVMTAGATASTFATAASTIPSRLAPVTVSPLFPVFVKKNNVVQTTPGILTINTDGSMSIGVVAGFGTNWTSGDTNNGFFQTCITYSVQ